LDGQIQRQEGDTNGDRKVDVWVRFANGERIEQAEDQHFRGTISARYFFENSELMEQKQVNNDPPPWKASLFATVEEELQSMARKSGEQGRDRAVATTAGLEPERR
jgi:hypothetical protein